MGEEMVQGTWVGVVHILEAQFSIVSFKIQDRLLLHSSKECKESYWTQDVSSQGEHPPNSVSPFPKYFLTCEGGCIVYLKGLQGGERFQL